MILNEKDIQALDRIKRLNIINSVSGIKPGNLIGTISNSGQTNLAVFSSVIHLGSNPALLGFIMRPLPDVRRHTYENILENNCYTINHIHINDVQKAHYTSVKFDKNISEFDACNFSEEYIEDFPAPFVKASPLKIGMQFVEEIPIKANGTIMMIGKIKHIIFPDGILSEEGYLDLQQLGSAGISGLNTYYAVKKLASFPYARLHELPDFNSPLE